MSGPRQVLQRATARRRAAPRSAGTERGPGLHGPAWKLTARHGV